MKDDITCIKLLFIVFSSLTGNLVHPDMGRWVSTPRSAHAVIVDASRPSLVMMPRNQSILQLSWAIRLVWPTLFVRSTNLVQVSCRISPSLRIGICQVAVSHSSLNLWKSFTLPRVKGLVTRESLLVWPVPSHSVVDKLLALIVSSKSPYSISLLSFYEALTAREKPWILHFSIYVIKIT